MQPDPTALPTQFSSLNADQPTNASQHGFPLFNLHLAGSLDDGSVRSPGLVDASSELPEGIQGQVLNVDNRHDNRLRSSYHRISEHENALAPVSPKKYNDGPAFKVVKKQGKEFQGPLLDQFPNEVLTHILSHLPAASLSAVSQVSRRFYSLVTTPHAWRTAFSRFFAGQDAIEEDHISRNSNRRGSDQEARENLRAEQRFFTRLTALASWRSEYILRTRLLRSLNRGKPVQNAGGHGTSSRSNGAANNTNAVVTYNSQLFSSVNHIHAVFNNGKKSPRFVHGTADTGTACTSDPNIGKVDNRGLSDPQSFPQFSELFPGDLPYGLGEGLLIGLPNVMDVSQPFGMVYGEGFPGGKAYFRSSEEMRGRFLTCSVDSSEQQVGIPSVRSVSEAISATWIAKSPAIPTMTDGLVGIMTGSSCGIVTTYSLGADNLRDSRLSKGEITARWILCPGVPIIALSIDESYSIKRKSAGRIWAVALNALGEVFYLTDPIQRVVVQRGAKLDELALVRIAWETGHKTAWILAEPTRRVARPDPYQESEFDGSYSPMPSSKSMKLSKEQLIAKTREIEKFLSYRPMHFRKACEGWDMRRKLEVDFAGDDGHEAGENIFVICSGVEESEPVQVQRFTRLKSEQASLDDYPLPKTPPVAPNRTTMASLFGGGSKAVSVEALADASSRAFTQQSNTVSLSVLVEEWRSTKFTLDGQEGSEITASSIDMSNFALLTAAEDPLLTINGMSSVSTPCATPVDQGPPSGSDVPGYRARFLAVGTNTGTILIWNMRGAQSANSSIVNELNPLRKIHTDSPQISCLALSALYLVHGGNDGLVQTWDPLASTMQPLRTLHSRFSSRARRRLIQAEASIQGVGINLYAAGALAIDPDPTVLRGMVSLGTHLRYWSYSSTAADQYSSKKRLLRRSRERGSNGTPDRFTNTGRGALMDYIATEQADLKQDKERKAREEARLRGRFGVGLHGLSDEEAIRYAEMISREDFEKDQERQVSDTGYSPDGGLSSSTQSGWSSETVTPEGSVAGRASPHHERDDEYDHDIEEAIRLSLLDGVDEGGRSPRSVGSGEYDITFMVKQKKSRRSASSSPSTSLAPRNRTKVSASKKNAGIAVDDLEFALQLSLAEEESRRELTGQDFPALEGPAGSKGKGKAL